MELETPIDERMKHHVKFGNSNVTIDITTSSRWAKIRILRLKMH